jgi:ABC-type glycerol-3-phosphate transport system permease component
MAAVVIATVPILLVYIFFQRYFVEGIAASGVKG